MFSFVTSFFPVAFKILSLSSSYLSFLGFLESGCPFLFSYLRTFSHFISLNKLFVLSLFSFWDSHNVYVSTGWYPRSPLDFLHSFFNYFFILLLWLDNFKQPVFKFADFFPAWLSLWLNPPNVVFSWVIAFFSSQISVGFFFQISCFFVEILILVMHYLHELIEHLYVSFLEFSVR